MSTKQINLKTMILQYIYFQGKPPQENDFKDFKMQCDSNRATPFLLQKLIEKWEIKDAHQYFLTEDRKRIIAHFPLKSFQITFDLIYKKKVSEN